jgi:cyclic lactone autoinducer peptide
MKRHVAKYLNVALMIVGAFFAYTNSACWNRPETPQEFLRK